MHMLSLLPSISRYCGKTVGSQENEHSYFSTFLVLLIFCGNIHFQNYISIVYFLVHLPCGTSQAKHCTCVSGKNFENGESKKEWDKNWKVKWDRKGVSDGLTIWHAWVSEDEFAKEHTHKSHFHFRNKSL